MIACLSILFLPYTIYAQEFRVTGVVRDTSGISVVYATVVASSLDSVAKYHSLTDSLGGFDLYLPNGEYEFSISMMGYQPHVSKLLIKNKEVDLRDIVLAEQDRYLKEAVVTDSRIRYTSDGPAKYGMTALGMPVIIVKTIKEEGGNLQFLARVSRNDSKEVYSPFANVSHRRGRLSVYGDISFLNMHNQNQLFNIESFGTGVPLISGLRTTSIHIPYSLNGTAGLSQDLTPKDFIAFEYWGSQRARTKKAGSPSDLRGRMAD